MNKVLDSGYVESYVGNWKDQKKYLERIYSKKYNKKVKITRVKTDTKGLRCFIVEEV